MHRQQSIAGQLKRAQAKFKPNRDHTASTKPAKTSKSLHGSLSFAICQVKPGPRLAKTLDEGLAQLWRQKGQWDGGALVWLRKLVKGDQARSYERLRFNCRTRGSRAAGARLGNNTNKIKIKVRKEHTRPVRQLHSPGLLYFPSLPSHTTQRRVVFSGAPVVFRRVWLCCWFRLVCAVFRVPFYLSFSRNFPRRSLEMLVLI